jgi:hypothetical protein
VKEQPLEELSPDICTAKIFEISGEKFAPDIAVDLWPKILKHKWLLSEKLRRDVGLRTACIDYTDNMEQAHKEFMTYQRRDMLAEMGAQTITNEFLKQVPLLKTNKRNILLVCATNYIRKEDHSGALPVKAQYG